MIIFHLFFDFTISVWYISMDGGDYNVIIFFLIVKSKGHLHNCHGKQQEDDLQMQKILSSKGFFW